MKQIYIKYDVWEDFINGMYDDSKLENESELVSKCIVLLSNETEFYQSLMQVYNNWVNSCDVNLSNRNQNRRAWLGAAACNIKHNAPEYITRIAWSKLTDKQRYKANMIAESIIRKYEAKNKKLYSDMGEQVLF